MKISQRFNLNKSQAELDFVDINTNEDLPLFLDPFFLSIRQDNWSNEASRNIRSFFERVVELLNQGDTNLAKLLFRHLHEPNSTCLGMSRGIPSGRGVGQGDTDDIFESIANSRAARTGLIQDFEDNLMFVDGFGKDKLSDMTTNIIRKNLLEYTKCQCLLHEIEMTQNVPSNFYWNRRTMQWEQEYTDALIIDNRQILLVPKAVVSFCKDYTPTRYYQHFVLNFMQNENLDLNSALVQQRKNGTKFVTKKSIEEHNPYSKDFIAEFSQRNPQVLENFKSETKTEPLTNLEFTELNIRDLVRHLTEELRSIPSGGQDATRYHKLIMGILEMIFYPHLIYPSKEREIHNGRKRIDIVFDNAANSGIFLRLSQNMGLPSPYIMVECKNYSADPANPELDQLSGRFSLNRGKVGFLLCRTFDNKKLFIQRCQDTYRDDRGLIIPLSDEDVIELLEEHNNWNTDNIDRILTSKIREITIN